MKIKKRQPLRLGEVSSDKTDKPIKVNIYENIDTL